MRTYTVTRKKGSKLGNVSYSVGTFSFQFKKGSSIFRGVPEVIAVKVEAAYKADFNVKLEVETAEPDEIVDEIKKENE